MTTLEIVLSCTTTIFFLATLWLLNEFRKKFTFMDDFRRNAGDLAFEYQLDGIDSVRGKEQRIDGQPGMHTFEFTSDSPFTVLVGFHLVVPQIFRPIFHKLFGRDDGFDYYGRVSSCKGQDNVHRARVSTWFGRSSCLFQFIGSTPNIQLELKSRNPAGLDEQAPSHDHGIYRPHFYQKYLGWYA